MQKIIITRLLLAALFLSPNWAQSAECDFLKSNIAKERDLVKRRALYLQAVAQCPDDTGLLYGYGFSLERLRRYDEALRQYQQAVDLDPNMAKAYFSMGDIYAAQGKLDDAVLIYQMGLQVDPYNARALKKIKELLQESRHN